MIANGYTDQPTQPLQQHITPTQPQPQDIVRNDRCVQHWRDQLSNKNIFHDVEYNRLKITDNISPYQPIISIISIHCPRPDKRLDYPKLLCVNRETFKKYPADIYLSYNSLTLQPEGFAMRGQLFLTELPLREPREFRTTWVYGIERKALDLNIDKLLDLNYLSYLNYLKNLQFEPTCFV